MPTQKKSGGIWWLWRDMRVLLDECLPRRLGNFLTGHVVSTVPREGWASIKNGKLLALTVQKFDVFLTHDGCQDDQQNLSKFNIAVIALKAPSNDITDLLPLLPEISAMIPLAPKRRVTVIGD